MKRIFTYCIALLIGVRALAATNAAPTRSDTARQATRFTDNVLVYKGEKFAGASILYGTIDSKNSGYLLLATGIDASGKLFRAAPYFNWAYRDNRSVGFRFAYGTGTMSLANVKPGIFDVLAIDLGSVLPESFSLENARIRTYEAGLYHRNYFGLDRRGTVGLFIELSLNYAYNRFDFGPGTYNTVNQIKLVAAPGVLLYVLPFISVECSLGLANMTYSSGRACVSNIQGGNRQNFSAGVDFSLLNCNFGISYHF